MKRSCKKSALKLSKKIAEKAAASLMGRVSKAKTKKCDSANTGYNIRARTYPRLIAGNSNASVTRWKRGNEQTKKQQKINQEISNRLVYLKNYGELLPTNPLKRRHGVEIIALVSIAVRCIDWI